MRKFLSLTGAFGKAKNDVAVREDNLPVTPLLSEDQAAATVDTLAYLIPSERLQMMAFDDYYPAVFYAIEKLPNSGDFIDTVRGLTDTLREHYLRKDFKSFEKSLQDHAQPLSILKFLMTLPAGAYPETMRSGVFITSEQPLYEDLKTNTRGHPYLHNEGVIELIETIGKIEDRTGIHYEPGTKKALIPERPALGGPVLP